MIHLERVRLPDGLRALAYRDQDGNLVVYVSEGLDAKDQRAAIMEAIRASRRAGWRKTGLLPVGIGLALTIRKLLGRARSAVHARPVAWAAAATATAVGATAAGIFIMSAPHPHGSSAASVPGPGSVQPTQSSRPQAGGRSARRRVHPVAVARVGPAPTQPAGSGKPTPAPTSSGSPAPTTPAPAPEPSPSATGTQPAPAPSTSSPAPSPSPSPAESPPGNCIVILGITVCLP
jgi:hypothetical protein